MKLFFIAALGMCTILITLPAQAEEKDRNAKVTKQNSSHETEAKAASKKSLTLVDNDSGQQGVDCFYTDNADDPFCKKLKQLAKKSIRDEP